MPFTKTTPMPPSSSSSGTTATTTTTSSSSLLFTPPRASPPTTTNGTSKSKILPRALTIPQIFRSSASNSLPPPSPASPRASTMMTRRFSNLRRLSFPKPVPVPVPLPSPPIAVQTSTPTTPNNNTSTVYRPMKNESRCLQHIARGIYVAFQDDDFPVPLPTRNSTPRTEELLTDSGHPFTHTISIVRASDTLSPPLITSTTSTSAHNHTKKMTMTLSTLPRPHDQYEYQMDVLARDPELTRITREMAEVYLDASYFTPERTFTSGDNGVARLGLRQMRAARDFILRGAGSGSGLSRGEEVKGGKGEEEERRVLITAPRDHRTDIMSIVVCILSDSTGSCPAEVVNGIDRQRGVMPVWKGCISRVGVEYIQEVC
ncbi:hypothetical protein PQX77_002222 [Marasmius sp. AFHP31]|nr:hypothetical protein PQX77_002222 [Marasmius sp. AFHP31]